MVPIDRRRPHVRPLCKNNIAICNPLALALLYYEIPDISISSSEMSERSHFGASSIDIRLGQPANQFYISILNNWCKDMSKEGVMAVLERHSPNTRHAFEKRIKVDVNGDFCIEKIIMDAFVLYASEMLSMLRPQLCEFSDCKRTAEYGFENMKASLCKGHKMAGMRLKGNNLCKNCKLLSHKNEQLTLRLKTQHQI